MIQGLHAGSIVFADFNSVSADLLGHLSSRLPGINTTGYPVRLNGSEYRLRLGLLHWEKRDLVANLDLKSDDVPSQSQLSGTLRLQEIPKRSSTKVTFEGRCARNFGNVSSAESTEAVRHLANDSSRNLLELIVTALDASPAVSAAPSVVRASTARPAAGVPKSGRKPVALRKAVSIRPPS